MSGLPFRLVNINRSPRAITASIDMRRPRVAPDSRLYIGHIADPITILTIGPLTLRIRLRGIARAKNHQAHNIDIWILK